MEKTKLEKLKTRWFRWLGQKTRYDKDTWVTLIDVNWSSWAHTVLDRAGLNYLVISPSSSRMDVYYIFRDAIAEANMEELRDLPTYQDISKIVDPLVEI